MTVPTPPGSNKPAGTADDNEIHFTKLKASTALTRVDPTGNLPHDQLAKMFPTQQEEDDEIWKSDKPNPAKGKFNQTQTVFGDDVSDFLFVYN